MKQYFKLPLTSTVIVVFSAMLCVCAAGTYSTNAFSDAFVAIGPTGNLGSNNYGGGGALAVAAGDLPMGEFQSVLEFNLSGAESAFNAQYGAGQWTIQSVSLQLTAGPHNNAIYNNVAAGQFDISLMQNNSWVEGTGTAGAPTTVGITYNSLTGVFINNDADQALGTFSFPGGTSGANNYNLGLASGLTGDIQDGDDLSLRLYAADNNVSYLFSSRTGTAAPELIITATPEPGTLPLGVAGLAIILFWRRTLRSRASA